MKVRCLQFVMKTTVQQNKKSQLKCNTGQITGTHLSTKTHLSHLSTNMFVSVLSRSRWTRWDIAHLSKNMREKIKDWWWQNLQHALCKHFSKIDFPQEVTYWHVLPLHTPAQSRKQTLGAVSSILAWSQQPSDQNPPYLPPATKYTVLGKPDFGRHDL